MITNNLGSIFPCRRDSKDALGVLENYKICYKGDIATVDVVCCIGADGNPIVPAFADASYGFSPLYDFVQNGEPFDDAIKRFVRGNKPLFGKVGTFCMVGNLTIRFNRYTYELYEDKSVYKFYVPKLPVDKISDVDERYPTMDCPGLICDLASEADGLNMYKLAPAILAGYKAKCVSVLTGEVCKSREDYVLARAKMKGVN